MNDKIANEIAVRLTNDRNFKLTELINYDTSLRTE